MIYISNFISRIQGVNDHELTIEGIEIYLYKSLAEIINSFIGVADSINNAER